MQPILRCLVQLVHEGCKPSHCEQGECPRSVYAHSPSRSLHLPDLRGFSCAATNEGVSLLDRAVVLANRAPTHRFRHVTHAIDARLRRLSLASWSSLVTNDDNERLRRGEADAERAAVPLMAVRRQGGREGGRGWTARPSGAVGALLVRQTSGYAGGCERSRVNASTA